MLNSVFKFEAGPFFLYFKKHNCIHCGGSLERKIEKTFLKDDSEEARKIKSETLYSLDSAPVGNITLCKHIFICCKCNWRYSIKEMKELKI